MPEISFPKAETSEAVELRSGQDDPIVMYLIVRETLGMGPGKIAAQCAHAAQMLAQAHHGMRSSSGLTDVYNEWLETSYRKVVLRADDKEWAKLKDHPELDFVVVRDAGLTEVEPGSETVIGLWPMLRSDAPKLVQRLQALK